MTLTKNDDMLKMLGRVKRALDNFEQYDPGMNESRSGQKIRPLQC